MKEKAKSLEALLRFRVAVERMQWLRVQSAHMQVEKVERELEELERSRVEAKLQLLEAMRRGVQSRMLDLYSTSGIEEKMTEQAELRVQVVSRFESERKDYLERRQERETVENVLARMKAEIEKELERREQMRVDDDTLQRFGRRGRKSPFVM